jgi:peptidoglycan hydrolase-like protein with peptidoglycan-binding domain
LAELEALINQLNTQLVATFTRNLTIGSSGADVKNLQVFLNDNGYTVASSGTGSPGHEATYFGAKTQAALAKWQKANNLPATGFFGALTREVMKKLY